MKRKDFVRWISLQLLILILTMTISGGVSQAVGQDITASGIEVSSLQEKLEKYIEEHKDTTAALSVAVFQNEDTIYQGYHGYANMESSLENSPDTVMEWGSVTKILVWVSVMQLAERGEIDLNEDIKTYLDEDFLTKLKYNQPLTMMNLMHHNAGFEENIIGLFTPMGEEVGQLGQVLKDTLPNQLYEPGTVVAYSNWGAGLAGYIVERVSGMSFADYVHKYIFQPLGMKDTALLPALEDNSWVSQQRDLLKCYTTDLKELGSSRFQIGIYPAGMATGTLDDLLLFGKAMVVKDGESLKLFKKEETLDQFLSPTLFYNDKNSSPRNAHGLWADTTEVLAFGHGGNTYGCTANLYFDPISGIGFVVMANQSGETVYSVGLQEMIFGEYPQATDKFQKKDIRGLYTLSRTMKKGGLRLYSFIQTMPVLSRNEQDFYVPIAGMEIRPIDSDQFLFDDGRAVSAGFISQNEGKPPILEMGVMDFLPKNKLVYGFEVFLLFILLLSLIYSLYTIIRAIVRKIRRRPLEVKAGERTLMSFVNLGLVFSFVYVIYNALNFKPSRNIRFGFILCAGFSIWIAIYILGTIFTLKGLEKNKQRRRIFNTILSCMAILLNSFYWQWFKFW